MTIRDAILASPDATDAEVVALLPPVTARPVPLATLAPYLRKHGLMAVLAATAANAQAPERTRVGIGAFLDHLADPRQTNLDTTDPVVAVQVREIVAGLAAAGRMTDAQVADVYAMGGGLRFAGVTEQQVAGERAALAAEAAVEQRRQEVAADDAEVTAAWNQWSNDRDVYVASGGARPAKPFGGA